MPGRPDQDGSYELRILDAAWRKAQHHWHDDMTRRFNTGYWMPLLNDSRSYLEAASKLMKLLDAAERDTEY
jgi:hypothetical protein